MGCDIHAYIEHKRKEGNYWRCFGGRINPGRWYGIFARMADVRNYFNDGEIKPISSPKGLPTDLSFEAKGDNEMYIIDDDGEMEYGCCKRSDAERWVKSGSSIYTDDTKTRVTHPDWHSHSYLTIDEYRDVIETKELSFTKEKEPEYYAILKTMESLAECGEDVRLVFWFDN